MLEPPMPASFDGKAGAYHVAAALPQIHNSDSQVDWCLKSILFNQMTWQL